VWETNCRHSLVTTSPQIVEIIRHSVVFDYAIYPQGNFVTAGNGAAGVPLRSVEGAPRHYEKVLSKDLDTGSYTRLLLIQPDYDSAIRQAKYPLHLPRDDLTLRQKPGVRAQ